MIRSRFASGAVGSTWRFARYASGPNGNRAITASAIGSVTGSTGEIFAAEDAKKNPIVAENQHPGALDWQLTAIVGVTVVITLAAALELRRRTCVTDLSAVGLVVLSLLTIPINLWVPGGSFLVWAALCLVAAAYFAFRGN